jgi:hypothetical protein
MQVKVFEALRKLGWNGDFICSAQPDSQQDLGRLKDPRLYTVGPDTLVAENLPAHREIAAAAKAAGIAYPVNLLVEGWVAGMVIEAGLKNAGWPATPAKVKDALSNVSVDIQGLRGGSLQWTKDNHFRAKQYYRVFHWNVERGKPEVVNDWVAYDVK